MSARREGVKNGLDLFSGIGGISLALKPWVRTVAYCERDRYAQAVLLSRMHSGELDRAPIWDDVTSLRGAMLPSIDIVFGGFPCQPYSAAARGRNKPDVLLSEFNRVVREIRPRYVFAENVGKQPIEEFCRQVQAIGYNVEITSNAASDVGAPHIGKRYWAIATANGEGKPALYFDAEVAVMPEIQESFWGDIEPESLRVSDGLPFGMDRARCLGNAVVPLQARVAFETLLYGK